MARFAKIRLFIFVGLFFSTFIFFIPLNVYSASLSKERDSVSLSSWYITMENGLAIRNDETVGNGKKTFRDGPDVGFSLGYIFNRLFRVEAEILGSEYSVRALTDSIRSHPVTTTEMSLAYMFNGYLSLFTWQRLTPYIGAGLGYAQTLFAMHTNLFPPPSFSHAYETTGNFAYQAMAGLSYALADNMNLGLEYRYFRVPHIAYPNVSGSLSSNNILLKLTYLFNSASHHQEMLITPVSGIYFAMEGGASFRETEPYSEGTKSFQNGPVLGGAIGYNFSNKVQVEGEYEFRQNTVDKILLAINNRDRPTGDEITNAFMANVYFSPINISNFLPYLGGGVGYADTSYSIHVFLQPNPPAFAHPRLHSSGFAYQIMPGISYLLASNAKIGVEYRYFRVDDMKYDRVDGSKVNSRIVANTVLLRLTYLIG